VLAVVVIDHNTQPGNPVAASSKQLPAGGATKKGAGTASSGRHGTTTAGTSSSSLASHKGNGRVSTRAAGNATSSVGGSGAGPGGASSSINPASAASPAVNLPVPAHFGPLLRRTWARANPGGAGIKASDIQSTAVGSVFYAAQPAVHTYWAISQFVPSALAKSHSSTPAGAALLAEFHGTAVFEKVAAQHWAYVGSFNTGTCPGDLPLPVLTAWGLCTVGS
jgi:hypothetical protein